jgi:hypothetical protein
MLKKQELESLVKRRRTVQDLDLDYYLKVKSDILTLINDLNANKEPISIERITKLTSSIRSAALKANLALDVERSKYTITNTAVTNYDLQLKRAITSYIMSETREFNELSKKIQYVKQLLKQREKLNATIEEVFSTSKTITLTKRELELLFNTTNDIDDLNIIVSSGKLTKEDRSDPGNNEYQFQFSKNSSFKLSTQDLKIKINEQMIQCEEAQKSIDSQKEVWKKTAGRLAELLAEIEKEVVI